MRIKTILNRLNHSEKKENEDSNLTPCSVCYKCWLNFWGRLRSLWCQIFTFLKNLLDMNCSAGTGLLSMMAARAMISNDLPARSSKGMVTACESYLPMVKLMRKVLHINGIGRNISIISKRSDEVRVDVDIGSRADVLVSIHTSCFHFLNLCHTSLHHVRCPWKTIDDWLGTLFKDPVSMYNISCMLRSCETETMIRNRRTTTSMLICLLPCTCNQISSSHWHSQQTKEAIAFSV